MNALVTGGLGFIGSHITDLLVSSGYEVTVVDDLSTGQRKHANASAKYWIEDMECLTKEALRGFDFVFHTAALPRIQPSFDEPMVHEQVNVERTISLLCKLKGSGKLRKLVVSSSSAVYGTPERLPTPETERIDPLSPYALQKYAAERYAILLGERYSIPVVALRYFNVYGPRSFSQQNAWNAYSSVIGIFANQRQHGRPLTITGDGAQARDFVHVRDVARANLHAALSTEGGGLTCSTWAPARASRSSTSRPFSAGSMCSCPEEKAKQQSHGLTQQR